MLMSRRRRRSSFYLGEEWRGGVLLATFALAVVGGLTTDHIGPGPIVAYEGAHQRKQTASRPVGPGLLAMLVVVGILTAVAIVRAPTQETTGSGSTATYEACVAAQRAPA